MKQYSNANDVLYVECGKILGSAYEFNGEYDKALRKYNQFIKIDENADIPRIHYKMLLQKQAFEEYCLLFEKTVETFSDMEVYQQVRREENIFQVIMCCFAYPYQYLHHFSPFDTYDDFYTFMEEEYISGGAPERYEKVMTLFKQIKLRADVYAENAKH